VVDQPGKAALAAATAASTSSAVPSGMVPITSSVVELVTGSVPLPVLATHVPLTKILSLVIMIERYP
jgi:hypothetical protein